MKNYYPGNKKRTLTNFFSLSLLQIGNYVLPMITLPIISRIIGPENYGLINYAFAFVGYFVLLINAGFDLYGTRLIVAHKENREELSRTFSSIITAKACLLVIASLLFAVCLYFIPQLKEEKLLSLFTFFICIGWVVNPSWFYHGMLDSRKYAVFSFLSKVFFSIIVVLVVQQRNDYVYHPLITSLSHILVSGISFYYAIKKYGIKLQAVGWQRVKQTLNENRKLSLIWWISNQAASTNIVLAGFMLSTLELGYYSAALRIIIILQSIISMPLNTVLFPYIGQAFIEGYDLGIDRVHKAFPYLSFIAMATAVATYLFAKPIITGFYGAEFANAVHLLKILSAVLFFSTVNSAFGQQVLLNLKLDSAFMRFVVVGFVLNIIFLFFFLFINRSSGAAWAWPVSEFIIFVVYLVYFKRKKIKVVDYSYYSFSFLASNFYNLLKFKTIKSQQV